MILHTHSIVYNRDCLEAMREMEDNAFDLSLCDPPYGLGDKLVDGGTWSKKWQKKGAKWDVAPQKEYFEQLFRVSKNWVIFGGNYFIEHLPNCRHFIAWHKPYMDGMHSMSNVELALTSFDTNAKFVSINKGIDERIHLTQKPVALYDWLIHNYAKDCKSILDTHVGSASSRIAAYKAKIPFTGFELDTDYHKAAEQRFLNHAAQLTMF